MLIAASLGLGVRLVTELTVYMPRSRARLCEVYGINDNLVRGVVTIRVSIVTLLKIKLRVNENIII